MSLHRLLNPIRNRLRQLVSRAVIRLIDDAGEFQRAQVDAFEGETLDKVEMMGWWGLASSPPVGTEGVIVSAGGVRSHSIVISLANRQFRMKGLASGEVALHDDQGQVFHLMRDRTRIVSPFAVEISAPDVKVTAQTATIDSAHTVVTGDATVEGNCLLGSGATKFVMLADGSASTTVKAL